MNTTNPQDITLDAFLISKIGGYRLPVFMEEAKPGTIGAMVDRTQCECIRIQLPHLVSLEKICQLSKEYFSSIGWYHQIGIATSKDCCIGDVQSSEGGVPLCLDAFYEKSYDNKETSILNVSQIPPIC